nr:11894_t:CDS:2 [Entrophospora candida]CAG8437897.1 12133_t:CDS:2 [Entrophospora candida]
MSSSITSSSDPKRPNAVPYHSPIKDIDEIDRDVYGITSLLLTLMFAVVSVTNEKISDQDPNSGRTSGFTGLL